MLLFDKSKTFRDFNLLNSENPPTIKRKGKKKKIFHRKKLEYKCKERKKKTCNLIAT